MASLIQPFLDAVAIMTGTKVSLTAVAIEDIGEKKDVLFIKQYV